jgi:hypothetical protein
MHLPLSRLLYKSANSFLCLIAVARFESVNFRLRGGQGMPSHFEALKKFPVGNAEIECGDD